MTTFALLVNVGRESAEELGTSNERLYQAVLRSGDSWKEHVFDFAFVDIDGNGRLDIFMGLCCGYKVLMREGREDLDTEP